MRVLNAAPTMLPPQDRHLALVTRVGVLESLRQHKHQFDELAPAVERVRRHVARAMAARAAADTAQQSRNAADNATVGNAGTHQRPGQGIGTGVHA